MYRTLYEHRYLPENWKICFRSFIDLFQLWKLSGTCDYIFFDSTRSLWETEWTRIFSYINVFWVPRKMREITQKGVFCKEQRQLKHVVSLTHVGQYRVGFVHNYFRLVSGTLLQCFIYVYMCVCVCVCALARAPICVWNLDNILLGSTQALWHRTWSGQKV